jgi:EAL domain-containing protein (putative c-di-GMP-specific phosphodiesterase class I)
MARNQSGGFNKFLNFIGLVDDDRPENRIDDYGTGYNSELALVDIPCEYVKMDASFVRDVHRDTNKQALAKNLVNYAHARGIAVLAEGIETRDEMEAIISFGVDYLQGFYLGMPREKPQQVLPAVRAEIRGMTWKQQNT